MTSKRGIFTPLFKVCSACSVTYDYILHFENLDVEEEEMLQELGLREVKQNRNREKNMQRKLKDKPVCFSFSCYIFGLASEFLIKQIYM